MNASPTGSAKSFGAASFLLGFIVLAIAALLRALPFQRGKERLTRRVPLARLASSGFFSGRVLRGKYGILWDASTLPDVMTESMLWSGSYQDDVLACLALAIRPGDVVFDVGAHFGLMSIYASKLVGHGGTVVAFEPSPRNRKILVHHCHLNRLKNVVIEDAGLLDRSGEFEFYMTTGHSWNSTFDAAFAEQQSFDKTTVRADTLDGYVQRTGLEPAVLKIDTEGTEYECLIGGKCTIKTTRVVLVIEYNSLAQSRPGEDHKRLLVLLRVLGYRLFVPKFSVCNFTGRFEEFSDDAEMDGALLNVLCVPGSRTDLLKKISRL